ncbi:Petrobactin biosynthesis protein AsbE [Paenibacillus albicereus]|uniref:Petrobactin biosynthesis protein AsbE n=1 Tax=Paenibacillus albicereus TaxID=2726185 RepID=A0A6H2GZN8_9BACL|nr:DUF6005 family protein [Paenibacillus albicereus]QJC52809.1 Petrobactin biosynthesis protein AsbE [Paenibacillus albicereus]
MSIKIHCLMSCLCEIVKRRGEADHRPFYFGVWDAEFDVTADGRLAYHSERLSHQRRFDDYERLFGLRAERWHDPGLSPERNVQRLLELMEAQPEHRYLLVMLDMSRLPDRETKAGMSPFPHYLMVSKTDRDDTWFVFDPDFRWEGEAKRDDVVAAILAMGEDGAGYSIDAGEVGSPSLELVDAYFRETFRPERNELTEQVRAIVTRAADAGSPEALAHLLPALKQLKVLAIRKYGYEYALMYFQDTLGYSRDHFLKWANRVEDLCQTYSTAHYLSVKIAMTGKKALVETLLESLDEADEIERGIKEEVWRQYDGWRQAKLGEPAPPLPQPAEVPA